MINLILKKRQKLLHPTSYTTICTNGLYVSKGAFNTARSAIDLSDEYSTLSAGKKVEEGVSFAIVVGYTLDYGRSSMFFVHAFINDSELQSAF